MSLLKSGQLACSKTYSEYAHCHGKKFEVRISPDVLITKSGSGKSNVSRLFENSSAEISSVFI